MSSASKHEPAPNGPNLDSPRRSPSSIRVDPLLNESSLPPSYEFTIEQNVVPTANTGILSTTSRRPFRPPPMNQLTLEEAYKALDSADALWDAQSWSGARVHYATAAAVFHAVEDMRNEAFCLQRLGEVCRIIRDYPAARAHIWRAHVLFGRCGEIARQLMCERWLARVASDQGMKEEARQLLHAALDGSRSVGLRESQGWCLLRLGELNGTDKGLIQQALDIARDEKIPLLEDRCKFAASRECVDGPSGIATAALARSSNPRNGRNSGGSPSLGNERADGSRIEDTNNKREEKRDGANKYLWNWFGKTLQP